MHRKRFYIFIQLRFRMLYSLIFLLHGHVLSPASVKSISNSPSAAISMFFPIFQVLHDFIILLFDKTLIPYTSKEEVPNKNSPSIRFVNRIS